MTLSAPKTTQKVISVNINCILDNNEFSEHEFPEVNKYLEKGYKVVQFYQIAPSNQKSSSTLTFILEKDA